MIQIDRLRRAIATLDHLQARVDAGDIPASAFHPTLDTYREHGETILLGGAGWLAYDPWHQREGLRLDWRGDKGRLTFTSAQAADPVEGMTALSAYFGAGWGLVCRLLPSFYQTPTVSPRAMADALRDFLADHLADGLETARAA